MKWNIDKVVSVLRWGILTAAVVFVILGCLSGGAWDVLTKAINICSECIGLG
jgi:hypothetical protein